ncbi:MAG: hypothetical protein AAGF73_14895 [Actinomycetota bacterium]
MGVSFRWCALAAGLAVGATALVSASVAADPIRAGVPYSTDFESPEFEVGSFGFDDEDDVDGVGGWFVNKPFSFAPGGTMGPIEVQEQFVLSGEQAVSIVASPDADWQPSIYQLYHHDSAIQPDVRVTTNVSLEGGDLDIMQWGALYVYGQDDDGNFEFITQVSRYGDSGWCLGANRTNCQWSVPGEWYEVVLDVDFETKTVAATFGGESLGERQFFSPEATSLAAVGTGAATLPKTQESTLYVDDISITAQVIESGEVNATSDVTTVELSSEYTSPVVVATPNRAPGSAPVAVRVSNVTSDSFDVRLQALGGGPAESAEVSYVVVEEGVWNLDGAKFEAVRFDSTVTDGRNNWVGEQRSYGQSYTDPVVVGQVMTENDSGFSAFWSRGVGPRIPADASTLYVGKHVGEDPDVGRVDEEVGYLVFESGRHAVGDVNIEAGRGGTIVRGFGNAPGYQYTYDQAFSSAPDVVVSTAGMRGRDGGIATTFGDSSTTSAVDLSVTEDRFGDEEEQHTFEAVGYVAVD